MKAPKKPKKADNIPKQNKKLAVKKLTKRTTAEPPGETNSFSNGSSQVQNEHPRLVQTDCTIGGPICKNKMNGGSAANCASNFLVSNSVKIKLQLFPADEHTRSGLEKDGYCPYLELTLSPRKRISSVLKHIMTKWGSSSIAIGEPKLLSSSVDDVHMKSQRVWTLDDSATCVGDVLEILGQPSTFRLWYCWFHKFQSYPSASASIFASVFSHREALDNCSEYYEKADAKQHETMKSNEFQLTNVPSVEAPCENNLLGKSNYHEDKDVEPECNSDKNVLSWYDNCTNISIGALLSEASLQGKLNADSKKDACMSNAKQDTSGINMLVASNVHHIASSILDAEDTCSSFSFRKLLSSGNGSTSKDNTISTKSQALSSSQVATGQGWGSGFPPAKIDSPFGSEVYNDDRSLGLRSIKWTDSLGPFDLFVKSSGEHKN